MRTNRSRCDIIFAPLAVPAAISPAVINYRPTAARPVIDRKPIGASAPRRFSPCPLPSWAQSIVRHGICSAHYQGLCIGIDRRHESAHHNKHDRPFWRPDIVPIVRPHDARAQAGAYRSRNCPSLSRIQCRPGAPLSSNSATYPELRCPFPPALRRPARGHATSRPGLGRTAQAA